MRCIYDGYLFSDDKSLLDLNKIINLLNKTYWAKDRVKECQAIAIDNSICYGVYFNGLQVGFARVITDYATCYILSDVVIDERHRGKGIGKQLVKLISENKELQGLSGMLTTREAHLLYEKFGFKRDVEHFMFKKRTV